MFYVIVILVGCMFRFGGFAETYFFAIICGFS